MGAACATWLLGTACLDARQSHGADPVPAAGPAGSDRSGTPHLHDNAYYTTHGNASINCGGDFGTTIADMRARFPEFEARSTWNSLPDADTVVRWARDVLGM